MGQNLELLLKNQTGLTDDSRKVKKGYVFVAVRGRTVDGHDFIGEAIKNGATLIVGERDLKIKGVRYLKVGDSREVLGRLSSVWYGNPSENLRVIGITGTKGKTTTVHLVYHILTNLGEKVGLISSIAAKIGDKEIDTGFHVTSPDVISLHKFLKEMVDAGCKYAVVEVSSHGIDQKRIAGVNFEVGVLTNIAPEHLDYHKTFAEYKKVKTSFINSCRFKVIAPRQTNINALPGEFNNLNAEAAVETVEKLGFNRKKAIAALDSFDLPEGRLEEIKNDKGFRIFIDFAHTPDSLEAVLRYLRTKTKRKLIAVFGCAGERDKKKRFKMGKISVNLADISVFTAEDPRTEDVNKIIDQIIAGAKKSGNKNFFRIPERGEAIFFAIQKLAERGDIVAILGKGHEKSMAYGGAEHPWSDREMVINVLGERKDIGVIVLAGGLGKRMKSDIPKVLLQIAGRPMIALSLENLRKAQLGEIVIVVGYKKEEVMERVGGRVKFAVQKSMLGTADAAAKGLKMISKGIKTVVVLNGDDSAFYLPETIRDVIAKHEREGAILTFVSLMKENPSGLGRVIRDEKGNLVGIIEEKEATDIQRRIKEVNDGLYVFDKDWLANSLLKVRKSPVSGEYYLVDLVAIALSGEDKVVCYQLKDNNEWFGINTREELAAADKKMRESIKGF